MSSESSGTHYEVLERLGKYKPKSLCFRKDSVAYCFISDNTANVSEDSIVTEKDYNEPSKVTFIRH